MFHTHAHLAAPARTNPTGRWPNVIRDRFDGPGGYYNAGNLLGLATALTVEVVAAVTSHANSPQDLIYAYFLGSPSALALTIATGIFLVSGETYHRAWAGRSVPDVNLNRIADLLSVGGASALSASLIFAGQLPLAIASGVMIIGGKLGSAITCDDRTRLRYWPKQWIDPFRGAVLAGRAPGLIAAVLDLVRHLLGDPAGVAMFSVFPYAMLVICYLLWIKADLLLIGSAGSTSTAGHSPQAEAVQS